MYFLDTNTCIYYLNGKYESIKGKLLSISPEQIQIPSVVKAELLLGAYKSKKRNSNLEKIEKFLQPFEVVPFEDRMTYIYADIRFEIEKKGNVIGPNDMFIASIVKYHNGILVTNNEKEFNRIKDLKIDNWVK
jgi:tRNA(fMet)-specific endonuclease VapC